jgi:hypothetical protein
MQIVVVQDEIDVVSLQYSTDSDPCKPTSQVTRLRQVLLPQIDRRLSLPR